jgi:hypothetical protein
MRRAGMIAAVSDGAGWGQFAMVATEEQLAYVTKTLGSCQRPKICLLVLLASIAYLRPNSTVIAATPRELAEFTGLHPVEVSAAFRILTDLGITKRISRGQYELDPRLAWKGRKDKQAKAIAQFAQDQAAA